METVWTIKVGHPGPFFTVELENNPSELMNHKNRHQGPYKRTEKKSLSSCFPS